MTQHPKPMIGSAFRQIVAKPSEITPLTANALAEVIDAVGLPRGVFNIVHGYGADVGSPLYVFTYILPYIGGH
jgi:delta 1-pyrroline-5-carboxylate dehydrogenase